MKQQTKKRIVEALKRIWIIRLIKFLFKRQ